jgi:hypothetical protein
MHGALAFLANNQSQEIRFILSITSPTLFPFCWKIFSFWTCHNNQSTACQTNKIPLRDFFPLEIDFKKHSKKEKSEPGITYTTPNHLQTIIQIFQAKGHARKRWCSVSTPSPHITQAGDPPVNATPLEARFVRVGIRDNSNCHEKTITFEGAQLSHTLNIVAACL